MTNKIYYGFTKEIHDRATRYIEQEIYEWYLVREWMAKKLVLMYLQV